MTKNLTQEEKRELQERTGLEIKKKRLNIWGSGYEPKV